MSKTKKTVKETVKKIVSKDLLRDANTGVFYEGKAPKGKSPTGTKSGVPYWEV
jgi:hypothetical protein